MRIACISAGKDSVAMLILALRAGIRFDHIYYVYMRGAERANAKKYKDDKYNRCHFPLVEAGITEQQCYDFCKSLGLLHPFYKTARRMGCWQCACQGLEQLRNLYIDHPDKWAQLQKWQDDCPFNFKPDGVRVEDLARRFDMEGQQLTVDFYDTESEVKKCASV